MLEDSKETTNVLTGTELDQAVLSNIAELTLHRVNSNDVGWCRSIPRAHEVRAILLWHNVYFTASDYDAFPSLRVIARIGTGVDGLDLRAAKDKGIVISNVPDYGTNEVADHAVALLLALLRHLPTQVHAMSKGLWAKEARLGVRRLQGLRVGVVGLGRIGKAFAMRCKAFGTVVSFYDPYAEHGIEKALSLHRHTTLEELLGWSDIVSYHTPLNAETEHLFCRRSLESINQNGIVLLNTARGGVVETAAVLDGLESGKVLMAGLDVLETEGHMDVRAWQKYIPGRVLVSPHVAYYSEESVAEMRAKAAREIVRVLQGQSPMYQMNTDALMSKL